MSPDEIRRITYYLRKTFEMPAIAVRPRPQRDDMAEVYIGNELIGVLDRDDEDPDDLSYSFQMAVENFEALRDKFDMPSMTVRQRPQKSDSVEVYLGDEHIGLLYHEEDSQDDRPYTFQMAILDFDLDQDPF